MREAYQDIIKDSKTDIWVIERHWLKKEISKSIIRIEDDTEYPYRKKKKKLIRMNNIKYIPLRLQKVYI